jgi:hypothetical protein
VPPLCSRRRRRRVLLTGSDILLLLGQVKKEGKSEWTEEILWQILSSGKYPKIAPYGFLGSSTYYLSLYAVVYIYLTCHQKV